MSDEVSRDRVMGPHSPQPGVGASPSDIGRPMRASGGWNVDWKRTWLHPARDRPVRCSSTYAPTPSPAVDPQNEVFPLTREGKAALALFLLAATWWVTEVVPIGVTSITIAVIQALFFIRGTRSAFTDFMDPSVWFIIGSLMFGMVFTKTGLTRRMAYKMLSLVGERTSMIYLGCFVMTAALTLIMAHTAVAATVYPLFLAIYSLYGEDSERTRFGKGLFMGMALRRWRGKHHHAARAQPGERLRSDSFGTSRDVRSDSLS